MLDLIWVMLDHPQCLIVDLSLILIFWLGRIYNFRFTAIFYILAIWLDIVYSLFRSMFGSFGHISAKWCHPSFYCRKGPSLHRNT